MAAEQKKQHGKVRKAQLTYTKCTCIYCNSQLGCKSSLNRHYASCAALKHLLDNSPQSVNETDVGIRKRQLELIERIKEGNKKTLCSFCLEVMSAKKLQSHLTSVHNFPK